MITDQDRDAIISIVSKFEPTDYFVFDTTALSTALDANMAWQSIYLLQHFIAIYEAIADLYTFDVTGCLDSGLL
jgi:hypothetical protein